MYLKLISRLIMRMRFKNIMKEKKFKEYKNWYKFQKQKIRKKRKRQLLLFLLEKDWTITCCI